jgi:hypothetical protein
MYVSLNFLGFFYFYKPVFFNSALGKAGFRFSKRRQRGGL